jgi:hypothetical protein
LGKNGIFRQEALTVAMLSKHWLLMEVLFHKFALLENDQHS